MDRSIVNDNYKSFFWQKYRITIEKQYNFLMKESYARPQKNMLQKTDLFCIDDTWSNDFFKLKIMVQTLRKTIENI